MGRQLRRGTETYMERSSRHTTEWNRDTEQKDIYVNILKDPSINRQPDKPNVVYLCDGILFGYAKE